MCTLLLDLILDRIPVSKMFLAPIRRGQNAQQDGLVHAQCKMMVASTDRSYCDIDDDGGDELRRMNDGDRYDDDDGNNVSAAVVFDKVAHDHRSLRVVPLLSRTLASLT